MTDSAHVRRLASAGSVGVAVLALYASSLHSYLLFHSLIEIVTVAVSLSLAILTWSARRYLTNAYLKALGLGYGCIAGVDLLHLLAYKGMGVFPGHGANLPTQLWIAGRYLQAALLLVAPFLLVKPVGERALLAVFSALVALMIAWVYSGTFPDCFVDGSGLTPFKVRSEYVIMAMLLLAIVALHRRRSHFDRAVFTLLASSLACTVVSEACFTAYVSVYGFANLLGHFAKLGAFYLVYRAVLVTGITQPFTVIFRELKDAEAALLQSEEMLEQKVRTRTSELLVSEATLRQRNRELRALGRSNAAMMRATDEPTLLGEVCRIVCEEAGYAMAWVGFAEDDENGTIRPVAWGGTEAGYLAGADITWHDVERGRGPTGTAIRTGQVACTQDFAVDPTAAPWRENALRCGYRSSIALPLVDENARTFGVLSIYSTEAHAFTVQESRLLEDLARDLGFGLMVLRTREKRHRAEEEVWRLNEQLEERVTQRTAQLEAANKELEAFAYSVSHDLRAPLRHIDGFVNLLKEDGLVGDDTRRHRYMDTISDAAHRMGTLIDDLLSFSRMGRAELAWDEVDLGKLVGEVRLELGGEAPGREVVWRVGVLPTVRGDRAMLRIVLANLLANALKFTGPRDRPEIEVGQLEGGAAEVIIFVKDNGVGFDMKYAAKLFNVFSRLHGAGEFNGTGIGLANVRRVVTRHGGRTWAEGKVDGGATFYFSLPTARSRSRPGPPDRGPRLEAGDARRQNT